MVVVAHKSAAPTQGFIPEVLRAYGAAIGSAAYLAKYDANGQLNTFVRGRAGGHFQTSDCTPPHVGGGNSVIFKPMGRFEGLTSTSLIRLLDGSEAVAEKAREALFDMLLHTMWTLRQTDKATEEYELRHDLACLAADRFNDAIEEWLSEGAAF